jgi:hypothetical protein
MDLPSPQRRRARYEANGATGGARSAVGDWTGGE